MPVHLFLDFRSEHTVTNKVTAVNLGHWVLRSLFANLVEEEFNRDNEYRQNLFQSQKSRIPEKSNPPLRLQLPSTPLFEEPKDQHDDRSQMTSGIAAYSPVETQGLSIGLATPHPGLADPFIQTNSHLPPQQNDSQSSEKDLHHSQSRASSEKSSDYFSTNLASTQNHVKGSTTPGDNSQEPNSQSIGDQDKEEKSKESTTLFKKKFRMNFPKKLGRASVEPKLVIADEKSEESDKSEDKSSQDIEENFFGMIQKIRKAYEEQLHKEPLQEISTYLESTLPFTELLKPPPYTTIIIQEDQPDSGGVADIYQGTVNSLGKDADLIEKTAPMWLGELLLRVCDYLLG